MGDKTKGLYEKFRVERTDGRSASGQKHDSCEYFVLDLQHDPHSIPAVRAYAISARKDGFGRLADELEAKADQILKFNTDFQEIESWRFSKKELSQINAGTEMVPTLRLDDLREKNLLRRDEAFRDEKEWTEGDWALAAAGECGELCNKIKKRRRGFGKTKNDPAPSVEDCGKEIADTIIYLDLLAARMGIDLSQAIRQKFNEVSERVESKIRL